LVSERLCTETPAFFVLPFFLSVLPFFQRVGASASPKCRHFPELFEDESEDEDDNEKKVARFLLNPLETAIKRTKNNHLKD
jgi:hypothetical protein